MIIGNPSAAVTHDKVKAAVAVEVEQLRRGEVADVTAGILRGGRREIGERITLITEKQERAVTAAA